MNRAEVTASGVEEPAWLPRLRDFTVRALDRIGVKGQEVSLLVCDDEVMRRLNREYRGKDETTDVLSFAVAPEASAAEIGRAPRPVGDVVISLPMVRANARDFDVDEDEELKRLVIHGLLHLQGMDHRTNGADEAMLKLQEEVLASMSGERVL